MAIEQQPYSASQAIDAAKRPGRGTLGKIGLGAIDGGLEYYFRRKENPDESQLVSLGVAAATSAAWYFLPHVMALKMGYDITKSGSEAIMALKDAKHDQLKYNGTANFGGFFMDSDTGYTARQRAMNAIQNSRLNARSTLGSEARSLHRF